jgi:hypothetical protein
VSNKNTDSSLLPPRICIFVLCICEGCSVLSFLSFGGVHTPCTSMCI